MNSKVFAAAVCPASLLPAGTVLTSPSQGAQEEPVPQPAQHPTPARQVCFDPESVIHGTSLQAIAFDTIPVPWHACNSASVSKIMA